MNGWIVRADNEGHPSPSKLLERMRHVRWHGACEAIADRADLQAYVSFRKELHESRIHTGGRTMPNTVSVKQHDGIANVFNAAGLTSVDSDSKPVTCLCFAKEQWKLGWIGDVFISRQIDSNNLPRLSQVLVCLQQRS